VLLWCCAGIPVHAYISWNCFLDGYCRFPQIKNLDAIKDVKFLQKIYGIDFRNESLHGFQKEILQEMPNLRTLVLFNTDLENIDDDLLDSSSPLGFENLDSLSIKSHKLITLDDNTFIKLTALRLLDLSNNKLELISAGAFTNLANLEVLNLNNNAISHLEREVFAELPALQELQMRYNRLETLNVNMFGYNPRLRLFNVAGNLLERFDFDSANAADHDMRRSFPNLEHIDLAGNPWDCSYLRELVDELEVSTINMVFLADYLKVRGGNNRHVKGVGCRNESRKTVLTRIGGVETTTKRDNSIISKGNITTFVLKV
jgi:Leucine-rich repeat (LRR) protein